MKITVFKIILFRFAIYSEKKFNNFFSKDNLLTETFKVHRNLYFFGTKILFKQTKLVNILRFYISIFETFRIQY